MGDQLFRGRPSGGRWNDDDSHEEHRNRCHSFLRSVPVLHTIDDHVLKQLAACSIERTFAAGEVVMEEGDPSDDFYLVRSGQADVVKRDGTGTAHTVARLGPGSYFGELGLLNGSSRNATIRVCDRVPLVTYAFDATTFHQVIAEQVLVFRVQRAARQAAARAAAGSLHAMAAAAMPRLRVRDIPLLKAISRPELAMVMQSSREHAVPAGTEIFVQGEQADRFYVLLAGHVEVERDGAVIGRIAPGGFFGETGLLLHARRSATVRASEASIVWSISRTAFQRIVCHHLLTESASRQEVLTRINDTPAGTVG